MSAVDRGYARIRLNQDLALALMLAIFVCLSVSVSAAEKLVVGYLGSNGAHLPLYVGSENRTKNENGKVTYVDFVSERQIFEALDAGRIHGIANVNFEYLYAANERRDVPLPLKIVGVIFKRAPYYFVHRLNDQSKQFEYRLGVTEWAPVSERMFRRALSYSTYKSYLGALEKVKRVWLRGSYDKLARLKKGEISAAFVFADSAIELSVSREGGDYDIINLARVIGEYPDMVVAVDGRLDDVFIDKFRRVVLTDLAQIISILKKSSEKKSYAPLLAKRMGVESVWAEKLVSYYLENDLYNDSKCLDHRLVSVIQNALMKVYGAGGGGVEWAVEECW